MKRSCGSLGAGGGGLWVRGRWGGQRQSEAAGGGGWQGREPVSMHCAVKVRRWLYWKPQPAPGSSGKNGKRLASGSHDRKHNLPHCSWWKNTVGGNCFMQCDRLPACLMHTLISECYMLQSNPTVCELHFPFALSNWTKCPFHVDFYSDSDPKIYACGATVK